MEWHVRCRIAGFEQVTTHPAPAAAIEVAHRAIHEGGVVIGVGLLKDSLEWESSARAYAIWIKEKRLPSSVSCGAMRRV